MLHQLMSNLFNTLLLTSHANHWAVTRPILSLMLASEASFAGISSYNIHAFILYNIFCVRTLLPPFFLYHCLFFFLFVSLSSSFYISFCLSLFLSLFLPCSISFSLFLSLTFSHSLILLLSFSLPLSSRLSL